MLYEVITVRTVGFRADVANADHFEHCARGSARDNSGTFFSGVITSYSIHYTKLYEMAGIRDIRTKSYGSNNPSNCVKATIEGLSQLRTAEQIAKARGKSVEEILG